MNAMPQWVLLLYRLPREPSTPRITLWRKLRRLGALQLLDGLVALPLNAQSREQLEWLADEVIEAGGESSLWIGAPISAAQQRDLVDRLTQAVVLEYQAVTVAAQAAVDGHDADRQRMLARLRRELRHIAERDYFPPPQRQEARAAVEALATTIGAPR
jgi:hypothetical protein